MFTVRIIHSFNIFIIKQSGTLNSFDTQMFLQHFDLSVRIFDSLPTCFFTDGEYYRGVNLPAVDFYDSDDNVHLKFLPNFTSLMNLLMYPMKLVFEYKKWGFVQCYCIFEISLLRRFQSYNSIGHTPGHSYFPLLLFLKEALYTVENFPMRLCWTRSLDHGVK